MSTAETRTSIRIRRSINTRGRDAVGRTSFFAEEDRCEGLTAWPRMT